MTASEPARDPNPEELHSLTLVLASNRSGSTLLCHDIASLGGLGMARAYLHDLKRWPRSTKPTEADVLAQVAKGVQEGAPGVGAVKLMAHHSSSTWEAISGERVSHEEALPRVVDWAQRRFDRLFLVFLVRNALDQAISRVVADITGVYHNKGDANTAAIADNPLQIPDLNQRILRRLDRVARDRNVLIATYARYSDIGLLLTYEDLSRRSGETAQRLAAHARRAGFEVENENATRIHEKVISQERSKSIREGFLEYLRTETGKVPPTSAAAAERRAR